MVLKHQSDIRADIEIFEIDDKTATIKDLVEAQMGIQRNLDVKVAEQQELYAERMSFSETAMEQSETSIKKILIELKTGGNLKFQVLHQGGSEWSEIERLVLCLLPDNCKQSLSVKGITSIQTKFLAHKTNVCCGCHV